MKVDITTESDEDFKRSFSYMQSDGTTPIDITGMEFRMLVRARAEDETAEFEATTDNGLIVILDAANGIFSLSIPFDALRRLAVGSYVQSLIMIDPNTDFRRLVWHGTLTHSAGPSR